MWTSKNRGSYDRGNLRYPSDLTDGEWALIAPLIPPSKRGGRKRGVDVRDVLNGLMTRRKIPRYRRSSCFQECPRNLPFPF